MSYPLLLALHLLAAIAFIGTVFFEIVILEGIRKHHSTRNDARGRTRDWQPRNNSDALDTTCTLWCRERPSLASIAPRWRSR